MRLPLAFALVLAACGPSDSRGVPAAHDAPSASADRGPDPIILRVARGGGFAAVYAYPRLDSAIWTSAQKLPPIARVLAFDADAGSLAYVDAKGTPGRLDLRLGGVTVATKARLTSLTSSDGWAIFGITGPSITRLTPTGTWSFKPPSPPRDLFPQPDGSLLLTSARGATTVLWKMRPPDDRLADSAVLPRAERGIRTQVGDRLYLLVDSGLVGVRSRDLQPIPPITFDERVRAVAPTPSGDRLYVLTDSSLDLRVADRYSGKVSRAVTLPGEASELRMDPLGRYLLARAASGGDVWVVAIGTNRLIGAVQTAWEADLPFVAPDGAVALSTGRDVTFVDGETLRVRRRVTGGAREFWYATFWNGFRPRAAALDEQVAFPENQAPDSAIWGVPMDSAAMAADSAAPAPVRDTTPREATAAARPAPSAARPAPSAAPATTAGWIVSFAALLSEERARDLASRVRVGAETGRVVSSARAGATIYRVVLGPYATRADADRVGRESGQSYWVYQGVP